MKLNRPYLRRVLTGSITTTITTTTAMALERANKQVVLTRFARPHT